MKIHNIPKNTYTNQLSQHPNLFVGSLQLLFWFTLQPSVWNNQIQYLDPSLDKGLFLIKFFRHKLWKQRKIRRFLLQVLLLLPILSGLLIIGGSWLLFNAPISWQRILVGIVIALPFANVLGALLGLSSSMLFTRMVVYLGFLALFFKLILSFSHNLVFIASMMIAVIGMSLSLAIKAINTTNSSNHRTLERLNLLAGIGLSLTVIILFSQSSGLLFGIIMSIACFSGYALGIWRSRVTVILLAPWHMLIYWIDQYQGRVNSLLPKHLAFWDEFQYLPIWGLEKHLLLILEKNPIEGEAALNYLSNTHQRWAAQMAQIELCADAWAIGRSQQILTTSRFLPPADTTFRSFNSISIDVDVALCQSSVYNQRLALVAVADRLNNLIRELTISNDKYAVRFRPIAQRWQNIIDLHLQELIKESEERQEIDSPYIIGVPVTNRQQLFVGRNDISERLEKLLLERRSPPLLLYGQRRTGKTSLLNNLGRLLPTSIIPLFVDLQGSISSAKDHTGFLYNLAKAMINSAQRQRNLKLPPLSYETLATDPFTRFDEWLDNLETALAGNTALLALDEFEVLDRVLNEGRFSENDVLGMLRNLIQHRPTFKVLLAGSHTLDEFQRWSSYLINAQVIHLGYLQEAEARQLIETPIENFALRYEPSASQRVIDITKGHPFLVQLLCAEIVALKNNQDPSIRRLATLADVEAAIPEALEHGSMFFSDIERNQLDAQSLEILRYCAQQGEGAIISTADLAAHFTEEVEKLSTEDISSSIELLLRRELIETKANGYSIQLELIRRWFS
jgi:hypothetical protein